jgi:hypothetical protein
VFHQIIFLTISVSAHADSEEVYSRSYAPSEASHMSYTPDASPFADPISQEAYPAWTVERQIPMSAEEIEDIFFDLAQKFGFQRDSMRNMVCSSYVRFHQRPHAHYTWKTRTV